VTAGNPTAWLLLIHQLPPKPPYLRVKVWRRLQALGAVAMKNSVYVLPSSDETREDFEWVLREIVKEGGEATLCEARLIDGLDDATVQRSFHAARDADYAQIAAAARKIRSALPRGTIRDGRRAALEAEVSRLRRRLTDVTRIDFFGAPGREAAEGLLSDVEGRLRPDGAPAAKRADRVRIEDLRGRVWVTRKGIQIDRMATVWLIRRFVDRDARFKFVPAKGYERAANEVRFDMFDAEFTHEGDRCTFEVLMTRLGLDDRAVAAIAEIVHDVDLKDAKFGRPEAPGIERLIAGIAMANPDDDARVAHGIATFDSLYEFYRTKK